MLVAITMSCELRQQLEAEDRRQLQSIAGHIRKQTSNDEKEMSSFREELDWLIRPCKTQLKG